MNEINLLDETFDKNQSNNYHLSIQLGASGLSYCVLDTVRFKYIALCHYPFINKDLLGEVSNLMLSDGLVKLKYKSVSLLFTDEMTTLVPSQYFDENRADLLLRFNLNSDNTPFVNQISEGKMFNLFPANNSVIKLFQTTHPDVKVFHRTTVFIDTLLNWSVRWNKPKCIISINENKVDIGLAHNGKLDFFNSFEYKEPSDVVYYILNVAEQSGLSVKETEFNIATEIDNQNELFEILNNHLSNIKIVHPSERLTYSYIFDNNKLTRFVNLFNLILCA